MRQRVGEEGAIGEGCSSNDDDSTGDGEEGQVMELKTKMQLKKQLASNNIIDRMIDSVLGWPSILNDLTILQ